MIYRIATKDDFLQLADLRWNHEEENNDLSMVDKNEFIKKFCSFLSEEIGKTYTCFVAEHNEKIIANIYLGIINKTPKPISEGKSIGYITNVHTYAEYRGKGYGSELMKRVKDYAKSIDCEVLFVWPSKRAVPYYERLGFNSENDMLECPIIF